MSENEIRDILSGSTPEDLQVLTNKVEQATEELYQNYGKKSIKTLKIYS